MKKEKIIDASLDYIWKNGIENFSMRKLSIELKCSAPSIYHYYSSKEILFSNKVHYFFSLLFRLQLAWPEQSFKIFSIVLGDSYAPDGVMLNDRYLALVTIHGTIMVFFVLTAALSGTFSNLFEFN